MQMDREVLDYSHEKDFSTNEPHIFMSVKGRVLGKGGSVNSDKEKDGMKGKTVTEKYFFI